MVESRWWRYETYDLDSTPPSTPIAPMQIEFVRLRFEKKPVDIDCTASAHIGELAAEGLDIDLEYSGESLL